MKFSERIKNVIKVLAIMYLAILVACTGLQRKLLYYPQNSIADPVSYGLSLEEVSITTADKVKLQAWYRAPINNEGKVILYFHGNAGHIGYRAPIYKALMEQGFGLLALSYRGYGKSQGKPTEEGLYEDGRAAMKFLKEQGVNENKIIIYGESLGTGVATKIASEYKIGGIVLKSPFTAAVDVARKVYPFLPVKLLMIDKFKSMDRIKSITVPILIFHSENDDVIPFEQGRKLYETANKPKKFISLGSDGHDNSSAEFLAKEVRSYFAD